MAIVAGVDFGTLSVRVSIVDSERGLLASALAEYPLHRKKEDPEYATQSHEDHLKALVAATREAVQKAAGPANRSKPSRWTPLAPASSLSMNISSRSTNTISGATTAPKAKPPKSPPPLTAWASKPSSGAAEFIPRNGDFRSCCTGCATIPDKRARFATAFEHCDMIAATLCGITDPHKAKRSICAMGHKWLWNPELGGLPAEEFLASVDPLLGGVREKLCGSYATSEQLAGHLSAHWAAQLGLRPGIPIPVGAFDAHWDAIGAGCRTDDLVNVIGTSTCMIGITPLPNLVPGVCGVVQGSVHPRRTGIEAGLSAVGDIFQAIATRAGTTVAVLSDGLENYRAGQTGLLRLTWDNGDRTILVNPNLRGITLGWSLQSTAQDELFAAIEGTAFHTRVILDRMAQHGVPIKRVINAGGIPQKNKVLNQVYANVLRRPVLVPNKSVVSLGSAIFAFLAAGTFRTVEEAQDRLCPDYELFKPGPESEKTYDALYAMYRKLYFAFGQPQHAEFGNVMPTLINLAYKPS